MPIYRGVEGATIVAKKAYGAYGRETTPEVIAGYYEALKGRSLPGSLRAVTRCIQQPGRIHPPTCSEVLYELLAEQKEKHASRREEYNRGEGRYSPTRELTSEVFERQLAEAKEKYPHLFDGSSGSALADIAKAFRANIKAKEKAVEEEYGF